MFCYMFVLCSVTINNIIKQTLGHDYNDFPSTQYYYLAMAEDIFLRLLWVIGLILKQVGLAIIFSKTGIITMMRFETCVLVIYIF